ncbi:hypothetical protein HPP92_007818 [Vanilla planifolia]|uniref:Uncharacterized protein n=1 Tax=Vanilla planifolia TaxID=51239 RepID=A0A835RES4_VANPL|nr:hypothetical protein HPP92_007818 [Vanilla planifolia]
MAATWSRGLLRPLLWLNLMMFAAVLGLAGWCLDKYIDRGAHQRLTGNMSTVYLLVFTLIAGAVGVCSVLAGLVHLRAWRGDSLAAAISSALISWAITSLACGVACKHIQLGNRGKRLRSLEALVIILTGTQLSYLTLLHMGLMSSRCGVGYRSHCNAYGMMQQEMNRETEAMRRADAV